MSLIKPSRRLFLARAALAAPALITCPRLLEAGWQSRDSNYNQKIAASGGLGLQTNCTAFWEFETTSWLDATGNGSTLTGTGSPTTAAGKVGNAVSIPTINTDYLSCASNTNLLNGGSSFSVAGWINSSGSSVGILAYFNKDNNSFGQREWGIGTRFTSSNVFSFTLFNTSTTQFNCDSLVTVSSGFHQIVGTFDSSTGAALIYVDGSVSGGGVTVTGTMQSTASAPFSVGRTVSGAPFGVGTLVDQVGFYKGRILSASDVTALYNSNSGLSWAAML